MTDLWGQLLTGTNMAVLCKTVTLKNGIGLTVWPSGGGTPELAHSPEFNSQHHKVQVLYAVP